MIISYNVEEKVDHGVSMNTNVGTVEKSLPYDRLIFSRIKDITLGEIVNKFRRNKNG